MRRENVNKLIHLFLLALFLSYYGSITFFSHYHVVNGVTIVHSHFFCGHADTDGKADHTHSPKELTLIAYLTTFITLISAALLILISFSITQRHYHIRNQADEPVRVDRMRAALQRRSHMCGMDTVTPRMLRDTYAMRAVQAGATSDLIAQLMGTSHAKPYFFQEGRIMAQY